MHQNKKISLLKKERKTDYYDYNLIAVIILLMGFGLVMLYSTTAYTASLRFGDDMKYFTKQGGVALAAIAVCILLSLVSHRMLQYFAILMYLVSIALLILVRTPLGAEINGARRWLRIGPVQFQPAEFTKIAVIVFIPYMIVKMGRDFERLANTLVVIGAGLVQALFVLFLTRNLSSAIIIMLITMVMVFVAHPRSKPFLIAGLLMVLLSVGLVLFISQTNPADVGYRFNRIRVWLKPEQYASGGGYQIMQALYALGSGGILGKGLGNGTQKLGSVPEAENDMIFSIICEELGVFGGLVIILLFIYLLYRLFFIAQNAPDLFGALMVTGIFGHIAAQVVLNICVVLNVIPTTGITLPFVSYGGTSVLLLMAEMAIALSVSRSIQFKRPERDLWGDVVRTRSPR
ncbi:MAG: putative peptidoglycan glycosyltransferase FtsW [Lachnospiraceae bacterium]|nr:putative peptidoglycan glycosyltransferase FtsW [Lachnospiraceae bacterium]